MVLRVDQTEGLALTGNHAQDHVATNTQVNTNTADIAVLQAGKQPLDATLTALAAYNTNGIIVQTAADTFAGRTITGTANQVIVANGDGVGGTPTLSLPQNIHTGATPTFDTLTLTNNGLVGGYLRVGSTSAPANTTAGDLTAVRMMLGNNEGAFSASGRALRLDNIEAAASGTNRAAVIINSVSVTSASSGVYTGLGLFNKIISSSSVTIPTLTAAIFQNINESTQQATAIMGGDFQGLQSVGAWVGTTSTLYAGRFIAHNYSSGSSTGTITLAVGAKVINSTVGPGPITISTLVGVDVDAQTVGTTNIGVRIAAPAGAGTNYALQLSSTAGTAAGGITFGTDTTLYRIAADVLATDDSARLAGYLRAGALSAPANTTAGDITGLRLSLGNNAMDSTRVMDVRFSSTATANGATIMTSFVHSIVPTANSAADFRAINFQNTLSPGTGITLDNIEAGHFEGARFGATMDAQITSIKGVVMRGAIPDANAAGALLITEAYGSDSIGVSRPSGTSTITATNILGMMVQSIESGVVTATNSYGLLVKNNGGTNTLTNHYGIRIERLTDGSTSTVGVELLYPGIKSGQAGTTDMIGLRLPTASSTVGNTTGTTTNAFGISIGIPTWTSTTNPRTITNAAGLYIAGAPVASTNVTVTNGPYALWVDSGTSRFDGNMDFAADGTNFIFGTGTGVKIGTATSQKIGFWNATPIVQPSAYTQTYSTADKTNADFTSSDIGAFTGGSVGFLDNAERDNIRTQVNALRADLADAKQLINSIIDDLQALGLVG